VPDFPFAGRAYSTDARWDYTRHTIAGDLAAGVEADRPNEHTLRGKLVWTDRDVYQSGQRVEICADVISDRVSNPDQYHVVAWCYPASDPSRLVRRVLRPGRCKEPHRGEPVCIDELTEVTPSFGGSGYTSHLDPFYFASADPLVTTPDRPGRPSKVVTCSSSAPRRCESCSHPRPPPSSR
jgi:hypothetical protein